MAAFHGSDLEKIEQIYGIKRKRLRDLGQMLIRWGSRLS